MYLFFQEVASFSWDTITTIIIVRYKAFSDLLEEIFYVFVS